MLMVLFDSPSPFFLHALPVDFLQFFGVILINEPNQSLGVFLTLFVVVVVIFNRPVLFKNIMVVFEGIYPFLLRLRCTA